MFAVPVIAGGLFKPVLVSGGSLIGAWKRRIEGREIVCPVEPFAKLSKAAVRALARAFQRYTYFVGLHLRDGSLF